MSTTVAIPLLSTVCSPGTEKASILNHISLIWQPISATRTSTRPWCISRLPRNYCNKPVSGFAYRAPRSCGAQQEKTHEAHAISSTPTRLFSRLAGSAAECLPPYRAVLSGQLAVVSPLRGEREEEVRGQARAERSHGSRRSRVPRKYRTGPQCLDWNPELPVIGAAQLFQLRDRPRTSGCCAVRRSSTHSYQTSTQTGNLRSGGGRDYRDSRATGSFQDRRPT